MMYVLVFWKLMRPRGLQTECSRESEKMLETFLTETCIIDVRRLCEFFDHQQATRVLGIL